MPSIEYRDGDVYNRREELQEGHGLDNVGEKGSKDDGVSQRKRGHSGWRLTHQNH